MIGLYLPGASWLHRSPAGVKVLGLALVIVMMVIVVRTPRDVAVAAIAVLMTFASAAIPPSVILAQLRPLVWIVLFIGLFQVVFTGAARAVVVVGVLVLSVLLAALVTLTTRVTAMLDASRGALQPFRRFGVDPDRVGLLLALTIRCVPLLASIVNEVSQARRARGLQWSVTALVSPVVVRALRAADGLGDSLVARGFDDDGPDSEDDDDGSITSTHQ